MNGAIAPRQETERTPGAGSTATAHGAARMLSLAAAPTFAMMAVLTGLGGSPHDMLCSSAQDALGLGGMAPMYLLMSAFHATPWLRLVSSSRRAAP